MKSSVLIPASRAAIPSLFERKLAAILVTETVDDLEHFSREVRSRLERAVHLHFDIMVQRVAVIEGVVTGIEVNDALMEVGGGSADR